MGKDLRKMTRQEQAAYFKSKDYCGEELKVVMDAIGYGISADYLQLFEDTTLPIETMENMFTAMKEDYGVDSVSFLSTIHKGESGRIILEALKSGVPLQELKRVFQKDMLPVELREKILPLMQGREMIPEKIGEKMEFITEAVKELKESLLRQDSFIADLRKSMEEKQEIFSALQKEAEAGAPEDAYYLELEEQFRQAREDAEQLLEEREDTNRRLRELEGENKSLHEQLLAQQSLVTELQEKQIKYVQESRNVQRNQEMDSNYGTKVSQAVKNADYPEVRTVKSGSREKQNIFSQLIRILFDGTELFLRVAGVGIKPVKQLAKLFMGILAREKMEGKTSMKNLLKRGGDMHVFKFPQEQLKKVEAMAKKYGILYSLLPDFNKDGMRELVFHAESLPRMNALIEKLKAGQTMGLGEYFQNVSGRDIDQFFEETRQGRTEGKGMQGKETAGQQKNTGDKNYSINGIEQGKKPEWMDTGYLKMKDIEALPLDQRLEVLKRYQSGEHDPITVTEKLVTRETENHVVVRLPRQTGKFIHIPKEDFFFPEGSRTALAFLKKKGEMKVYTEHGEEMMRMTGNEIYHGYFDQANANIRTAMEHKSGEKERENSRMEGDSQMEIKGAAGQNQRKGEKNIPAKHERTAEKVRTGKQIKQPVKGR